jgi:ribonuclease Z
VGRLKKTGEVTLNGKRIRIGDVSEIKKGVKIVYSGDTRRCDNIVRLAKDADILIHDTTFADEVDDKMHTGAKDAAEIARLAGVKKLVLTHFSRRYLDTAEIEKEARKVFPESVAAKDFMRLEL